MTVRICPPLTIFKGKQDIKSEELTITPEDKVWASIERTIQIAQFEPIKIIVGEIYTLGPKENPAEVRSIITRKLICEAIQEGENIRRNPEQYMGESELAPDEEETTTSASVVRRRRYIK